MGFSIKQDSDTRKELNDKEFDLLAGRLSPDDIPLVQAQVIRIYLCSAGSDTVTERDAFVDGVYPRLRTYCRDKYGVEIQILDLHWGLPKEMIGHQPDLTSLGIQEIEKCQALSSGPNFITFLGQKYGKLSLPDVIVSNEFDTIMTSLNSHKGRETRNAHLLKTSYILDENNIPPVYVLKNKTLLIPELSSVDVEERNKGEARWEELHQELKKLIHKGVELAYLNGTVDSETRDRYFASDFENLALLGVEGNTDPTRKCILISRTIVDLKNYIDDHRTPYFVDIAYNEREERLEFDTECARKLDRLKKRLADQVTASNSIHSEVLWRYDDVIHPQLHKDYLQSLCQHLYQACVRLINVEVPMSDITAGHCVFDEVVQHWSRCKYTAATCMYSQASMLSSLTDYVIGHMNTPLVVYGVPGSGKSKMISKITYHISEILSGHYIVVLRYIGHTPQANDIRQLLVSISQQIALTTGQPAEEVPVEMKEVVKYFHKALLSIPSNTRLVIVLDGLEQLHGDFQILTLNWIPASLPTNVKLIITVNSTAKTLLDQLAFDVLPGKSEAFLEMTSATVQECEDMLVQLLSSVDRSVTPKQMDALKSVIEKEPLPLHVELLANLAKNWSSFTDISSVSLPTNCEEGIRGLFESLEMKHGQMMVSRAFSYMVASGSGLSDNEMEDILSLDEQLLHETFRDFHPPIRRVPPIKWLMLKRDIEAFLSCRESDGVTVSTWQHESFAHAVHSKYLYDVDTFILVHSNLADYFLGTWSGRAKPPSVTNGKKVPSGAANSDRKLPSQPHTFGAAAKRYNKRMYNQVPRHLHLACRYKELNNLVFFNYEWLYCKTRALSLQQVMDDFELNPIEEVMFVKDALRVSKHLLEDDINKLPVEITGHLLPYYATYPNIRSLIRQCDTDGLHQCALVPNFPYHHVPGTCLEYTLECQEVADHVMYLYEDKLFACKRRDDLYVRRFDLKSGEPIAPVFVSVGELHVTPDSKYFIVVDHVTEKSIKIHDAESGVFVKQIILLNHIQGKTSLYKKGPLCITNDRLCAVVTLVNSVLCICDLPSGEVLQVIPLEGKGHVCQISPDGHRVYCNSNAFLLSIDLTNGQLLLKIPIGIQPNNLVLTQDGLRGYLSNDLDTRLTVMHLNGGQVDMIYRATLDDQMPGDTIHKITLSRNDELILIQGSRNLLVYHRSSQKTITAITKPDDIPEEFKLPKGQYIKMTFTGAEFTPDSDFVVGTIFRNIYIWQISGGSLVAMIQAPIGVITKLVVSSVRSQIITHIEGSRDVQVWNIGEQIRKVITRDRLTDAVREFQVTANNAIAFVKCERSDELGLIDMRNGCMIDLLTHDTPVQDYAISPDGEWLLVSSVPRLQNTAFKLWNTRERRVVMELGQVTGYCVGCRSQPRIFMIAPKVDMFRAPYHISSLTFRDGEFYEHGHVHQLTVIKSKPFVTANDKYLVISSSLEERELNSSFSSSCICVFDIDNSMTMSTTDAATMKFEDHLMDILEVKPGQGNTVAAMFSCKTHEEHLSSSQEINRLGQTYGFFLLDVSKGSLTLLCIPFPKPSFQIGSHPLIFNPDCTLCINVGANIFHTPTGKFIGQVKTPFSSPPRAFALRSTVIVTYLDTQLHVTRILDGVTIGQCDVHSPISYVHVCSDDRSVLVGCSDGTVQSYTIIDPQRDNATHVLSSLASRRIGDVDKFEKRLSRSWDKIDPDKCPCYSRPPSAVISSADTKQLLADVKTVFKARPQSAFTTGASARSQMCAVM